MVRTFKLGRAVKVLLGTGALALTLAACGNDEQPSGVTLCSGDDGCAFGSVCLASGECGTAPCDFCSSGQVCVTLDDGTQTCSVPECDTAADCEGAEACVQGVCSEATCSTKEDCDAGKICNQLTSTCIDPPEACANDQQCPAGEVCITDMGVCVIGCADDAACGAGQICEESTRVCTSGCRDDAGCADGETCQDGQCTSGPPSCDNITCDVTERCNPTTFQCEPTCTTDAGQPNSCPAGQVCDLASGQCQANACPGQDPAQCDGNANTPFWNTTLCACVECLDNSACGGGSCNANGQCTEACQTQCDPSTPGTCGGNTPYCIANCCVQCIGSADCPNGQICLDGFCGDQPDCTADPNACPQGLTCQGGQGVPSQGGGSCSPTDPSSCPPGQCCSPDPADPSGMSGTCGGLGGPGGGCGLCNADCTCDGGLTCNGFICEGCSGPLDPACSLIDGNLCLGGLCLAGLLG